MTLSRCFTFLLTLLVLGVVLNAQAEGWPTRPIKFVVPFPPGGGNDIVARVVGERLSHSLGQSVVVENKPGAGGNIGAVQVARSAPDGYTYLIVPNGMMVVSQYLYAKLPFDPFKDFELVGLMGTLPTVLVVRPDVPANSVQELIALAKSKPDALSYGSGGVGTPHHLAAELFKSMTGASMVHIPYNGAMQALNDLLGGRTQVMFAPVNNVIAYIRNGKLRALGVCIDKRLPSLPSVPTVAEAGVPGFQVENWIGLVAPAGTPKNIISAMNREIAKILSEPGVRERFAALGMEPHTTTPEQMEAMIRADMLRWGPVIRNAGIKAD